MSLRDLMRSLTPAVAPNGVPVEYRHFGDPAAVLGLSVEDLWRTQPYLRTVVSFLARNIAQLGLHSFARVSDTDRQRVRDDPLPLLLAAPNPRTTSYELVYSLVADLALYDEAYWWVTPSLDAVSGWSVEPIRPSWIVARGGGSVFEYAWYDVQAPLVRKPVRVLAEDMLIFRGWDPSEPARGSSPVDALRQILAEQIEAQNYRLQVWRRGGRVSSVLTRPAGVSWPDAVRQRFRAEWQARWTGDGQDAGGTPILEDGMTLQKLGFSAHDDEFIAAAKLSLSMVASVYHVNPTMVGVLENANYSNVREFRRMLYGDTLGPLMAMVEDRINSYLVPRVSSTPTLYVEFNINEKLQGSFEEQTAALQSAVGRPWMTADEARGTQNMPSLGGAAAELVTPLNVLIGGQASARDGVTEGGAGAAAIDAADDILKRVNAASALIRSGFAPEAALAAVGLDPIKHLGLLPVTVQKPEEPAEPAEPKRGHSHRVKARAPATHEAKHSEVLVKFFTRQARVVKGALGIKSADDWWDAARWNRELAEDLYKLAAMTSKDVAAAVLEQVGFSADDYDPDRTLAFLLKMAERVAEAVNDTTKSQLDGALGEEDPGSAVDAAFALATSARAAQLAATYVTTVSGFATVEAAKQVSGGTAEKTWITGPKARPSHAAMDGQTVGIDKPFSNGAQWPGDGPTADEAAGCNCSVEIDIPSL